MRNNNRSNVLLVEILIAVLFFMLSATVLVRVFVTARNMTVRSGVESRALAEAQNVAEALYAADDVDAALEHMQFVQGLRRLYAVCHRRDAAHQRGGDVLRHGERLLQAARSRRQPGGGRGAVLAALFKVQGGGVA